MSVFGHIPESHLEQDDVIAAGLAASITRAAEPDKTIYLAHLVGSIHCMSCSMVMADRVADSDATLVRASEMVWATDIALEKHNNEFDGDAVLSEVLAASPVMRKKMAVEALHVLAHQLPAAQKEMKTR